MCSLFLFIACLLKGIPVSIRPLSTFAQLSFTYVGAMVASNKALAYVSYPTQVHMEYFNISAINGCFLAYG